MALLGLAILIFITLIVEKNISKSKNISPNSNLEEYLEQKMLIKGSSVNEVSKEARLGADGEKLIFSELQKLPGKNKIYMNSYIPKESGGTSELDLIMVSEYGVFVIESKNYGGVIHGNSVNQKWTQIFNNKSKFKFYNPILQNKAHIAALDNFLKLEVPNLYKSYIVFSDRSELRLQKMPSKLNVINTVDLLDNIKSYMKNNRKILTQSQIDLIDEQLRTTVNVERKVKEKHIETIKSYRKPRKAKTTKTRAKKTVKVGAKKATVKTANKTTGKVASKKAPAKTVKKKTAAKKPTVKASTKKPADKKVAKSTSKTVAKKKSKTVNQICPLCESKLVVRASKSKPGKPFRFYGCSNYPNCTFTKPLKKG